MAKQTDAPWLVTLWPMQRGSARRAAHRVRALRTVLWLLLARALHTLWRRRLSRSPQLPLSLGSGRQQTPQRPFLAFSGSGLLLAYFHGTVTYIRDHFHVDNLQLSAISGGCSTILALAMGIDLYQILLLGLHQKQKFLKHGIYLNSFEYMVEDTIQQFESIGITDEDVAELSARQQCFIGVTQCFPPRHCCMRTPPTRRDLAALWLSSMTVIPFFRTPGVYQGRYYVDGGFSAIYSVPDGQPWDDVIKITCFPWWTTICPPAMGVADIQPQHFMPTEVLILYPWAHQRTLIERGYKDAKLAHDHLVSRGLRPLPAPLTAWSEWEKLFAAIDENNLPPLGHSHRSTLGVSEVEQHHLELLRTHSASDLRDALQGPRIRRMSSKGPGSRSDGHVTSLSKDLGESWM
ncbi:unnamed protein product [Polarella glacialis]|uniref:PNPLA domain-containing protein n=1 Tax=Polarella glacialis TaxID=89957 RepID=A0A813LZH0_POLGL|nr:unnamed protein product [Polarella glacialis]